MRFGVEKVEHNLYRRGSLAGWGKHTEVQPQDEQAVSLCQAFDGESFQAVGTVRKVFFAGKIGRGAGNRGELTSRGLKAVWFQGFVALVWVPEISCELKISGSVRWIGLEFETPPIPWEIGSFRRIRITVWRERICAEDLPESQNRIVESRARGLTQLREMVELASS